MLRIKNTQTISALHSSVIFDAVFFFFIQHYCAVNGSHAHQQADGSLIIDSVSCSCTQTTCRGQSLNSIFPRHHWCPPPLSPLSSFPRSPTTLKLSTAWKTCLMFMVFECVDLADMLSLWCCNPVTNSVLYLLVGI